MCAPNAFLTPRRHLLQDASALCHRFRLALPRPVHHMDLPLQLCHETLLHRQQHLHPISYESSFPVCFPSLLISAAILTLNGPCCDRPTNDPSIDTFRVEYLLLPALFLGVIFNYSYSITEIFWAFSIFLEAVAILPQLFILQRTGEAETITTHYLAALGAYRGLYIPNWIYRYVIVAFSALSYTRQCVEFKFAHACLCDLVDTLPRILSILSRSWPGSCKRASISTSFMCTSRSTWPIPDFPSFSILTLHIQGTPGSKIRVASMIPDLECRFMFYPWHWIYPVRCEGNAGLEPVPVNIVIRPTLSTHARNPREYFKRSAKRDCPISEAQGISLHTNCTPSD